MQKDDPCAVEVTPAALAAGIRKADPILRRIYSTPEIENNLARSINQAMGNSNLRERDCGSDLAIVVAVVALA